VYTPDDITFRLCASDELGCQYGQCCTSAMLPTGLGQPCATWQTQQIEQAWKTVARSPQIIIIWVYVALERALHIPRGRGWTAR
jgi:hypothetical protein